MSQTIHIVDDDPSVRGATSFLLSSHGYSTRIYASGSEFLEQAQLDGGCVLLDLRMSDLSGLEVLERLAEAGVTVPVIMLTGHGDVTVAVQALQSGAVDFLQKPYEERELITALERALAGGGRDKKRDEARRAAAGRLQPLSQREMQVLRGLVAGMTNKEMARRLGLSPRTVEMHRSTMMADLGVDSAADAIRIALDAELTPLEQEGEGHAPTAAALAPMIGRRGKPMQPATPRPLDELLPPVLDALEGSTDCALLLDRHFNVTFLNNNARQALADRTDLVGRNVWDLFPDLRQTVAGTELQRAAEERCAASFEFFSPDSSRWYLVNVRPIPSGLQIYFRDLTGERTADAELRQSEERLRLALEASGDGTWDWNLRAGQIHLSRRYAERLDYGDMPLEAGLRPILRLIHPSDHGRLKERIREHLAGRTESFVCEYRIRARDGQWQWNLDRGRVVARDPVSGAALRMVAISTDIGTFKALKARVVEANERIKLAQEAAGAGLWDYDLGTRRVLLSQASRRMMGVSSNAPEEIDFVQWQSHVHPEDLDETLRVLDEAATTGQPFSVTFRVIHPSGEIRTIMAMGKLAAHEDGSRRMIGLNIDQTEEARSAEKLSRLEAELLNAAQVGAISAMAVSLADELNQPLTAISNYVQGLKLALSRRPAGSDPMVTAALEGAETSAKHAGRIVRRIQSKTALIRVDRQPEHLSDLVSDAARVALAGLPQNAVPVRLAIPRNANRVLVDRVQIQHVLVNLIRNAIEAMTDEAVRPEVAIQASVNARGDVEVRVEDRGPGISDEMAPRLFEPFVSTKDQGAGIGLAVCRTIVEAHGGRMWVEPGSEGGTSIGFTLQGGHREGRDDTARARAA